MRDASQGQVQRDSQMGYEHGVLTFLLRFVYLSLPLVPISIYFHEVILLAGS